MKKAQWKSIVSLLSCVAAAALMTPTGALALGLTNRSDTMSTSQAGVTATHVIDFTTATTSTIGSIGFEFCTTATGACTVPAGLVTTSATLTAQSGISGFALNAASPVPNGMPYLSNATTPTVNAGTVVSVTLANITNPTAVNATFYVHITTYTGTDGATGAVDIGDIAASTAQPISLSGVTPPILVFCVGTNMGVNNDCTTVYGNAIDFGTFSPTATSSGASVMQAQTNASGGYAITVNGTTLASGVNTIAAMGTQALNSTGCTPSCSSTQGTSQFGLNMTDSGGGSGVLAPGYSNGAEYRFYSGDTVASAPAPTNANTFTANYVVNIGGMQAAGTYTATMTYICTAAF